MLQLGWTLYFFCALLQPIAHVHFFAFNNHAHATDFESKSEKKKPFTQYRWVLKGELDPIKRIFINTDDKMILHFDEKNVFVNNKKAGTFEINLRKQILSFKIDDGKQPSFAIFEIDGRYYYRYMFDRRQRKLYLLPLDEKEGKEFISIEGRTLWLQILE